MAKKPTPAELKKQGEELGKSLADIRKKQHNFAMQIGKEGIVFHIDRKKPADVLWRNAKKDGGGPKGAKGRINMTGKIIELDCDDPDTVPKNLVKLAKKHFAERGQPLRLVLKGVEEEDDAEEVVEDKADERKKRVKEETPEPEAKERPKPTVAAEPEAAKPAAAEPAPEAAPGGSSDQQEDDGGGAKQDDALREVLQKEFGEMKDDIDAAAASGNKGVVKKVGGLNTMFQTQIEADPKKARSILTLLQNTLKTAKEAGDIASGDAPGIDPAIAARRSKLAELEKGVDDLLAEFAA